MPEIDAVSRKPPTASTRGSGASNNNAKEGFDSLLAATLESSERPSNDVASDDREKAEAAASSSESDPVTAASVDPYAEKPAAGSPPYESSSAATPLLVAAAQAVPHTDASDTAKALSSISSSKALPGVEPRLSALLPGFKNSPQNIALTPAGIADALTSAAAPEGSPSGKRAFPNT